MIAIWTFNILGLIVGIYIGSKLLLKGIMPRTIIKLGFSILLIFHTMMFFLFAGTASEYKYYLPLFIQGIGTGSLFVPCIMNMVASVQPKQAGLVAFLGIAARYTGFCLAIALINFFQLKGTNESYMDMATQYTLSNELVSTTKDEAVERYKGLGFTEAQAQQRAEKELTQAIKKESSLRAYMKYYSFIIAMLFLLILYMMLEQLPRREQIRQRANLHHLLHIVGKGGHLVEKSGRLVGRGGKKLTKFTSEKILLRRS